MKAKYIQIKNPDKVRYKINWQITYDKFPLILNKEYTVYAIEYVNRDNINFFIMDESGNIYPNNYPSDFFTITDNRMSKYWENTMGNKNYPILSIPKYPFLITFSDWINNPYFEEEMMEGQEGTNRIFNKYKTLIDCEYPDKNNISALLISDDWVMCNFCEESWEVQDKNCGVIICPNCKKHLNNPLWNSEFPIIDYKKK